MPAHREIERYRDVPFGIVHCSRCTMEIPEWQELCETCAKQGQNDDLLKLHQRMWKKYIFEPWYRKAKRDKLIESLPANG